MEHFNSSPCTKWPPVRRRSNLQWPSIGLYNDWAPKRRHAIIWTNADTINWRTYAALGGNDTNLQYPPRCVTISWSDSMLTHTWTGFIATTLYYTQGVPFNLNYFGWLPFCQPISVGPMSFKKSIICACMNNATAHTHNNQNYCCSYIPMIICMIQ